MDITCFPILHQSFPALFPTYVAMASISGGDRASYGSSTTDLNFERTPSISFGSKPCSMIEETKAANCGSCHPFSSDSSTWMKSSPLKAWSFSIRPKRWTPHSLQAWRRMVAFRFKMCSFSGCAVILTFSTGTTPMTAKRAPDGLQH